MVGSRQLLGKCVMATPSQQDFVDFAIALAEGERRFEESVFALTTGMPLDELNFTDVMCELEQMERKHWDDMGVTKASAWIFSHPTSDRAFTALSGKKKIAVRDIRKCAAASWERATRLRTIEDIAGLHSFANKTQSERMEIVADSNTQWAVSRRLRCSIKVHFPQKFSALMRDVARAFSDYFYSDKYRRMAAEARSATARVQSVRNAIRVILKAEDASVLVPIRTSAMGRKSLERLDATLLEFVSGCAAQAMPVRRLDATARERVLAHDLWACFFARHKCSKAKAIYYFMEFQGVEQPMDLRSLERMTADWKAGAIRKTGSSR